MEMPLNFCNNLESIEELADHSMYSWGHWNIIRPLKTQDEKTGCEKKCSTYEVNLKHNGIVRATRDIIETLSQNNKEKKTRTIQTKVPSIM